MRPIIYSVAISLDGYIADAEGGFDWIVKDPDVDFAAIMGRFDTLVMGRRTWDLVRSAGGGVAMPGMKSFVVSRTLQPGTSGGATILGGDWPDALRALREQPGKHIWLFGGGSLFASMLEAGLVDGVEVAVVPVLLGGGIPFLGPRPGRTRLELEEHKIYPKSGIVRLEYAVAPAG